MSQLEKPFRAGLLLRMQ